MSLFIANQTHYDEVIAKVTKLGLMEKLQKHLDFLANYGCSKEKPDNARVQLGYDFAPLSFSLYFQFKKKDGTWGEGYPGGLIFHGQHDGCGSGAAPTLAVTLTAVDEDWSVHT